MNTKSISYQRHRFPSEIISHAVWLYHRFCLSFREVEELLAERGIIVTYESIRRWCLKFGPAYARLCLSTTGSTISHAAWPHAKSLPPWPPPHAGGQLSNMAHTVVPRVKGIRVCISREGKSVPLCLQKVNLTKPGIGIAMAKRLRRALWNPPSIK